MTACTPLLLLFCSSLAPLLPPAAVCSARRWSWRLPLSHVLPAVALTRVDAHAHDRSSITGLPRSNSASSLSAFPFFFQDLNIEVPPRLPTPASGLPLRGQEEARGSERQRKAARVSRRQAAGRVRVVVSRFGARITQQRSMQHVRCDAARTCSLCCAAHAHVRRRRSGGTEAWRQAKTEATAFHTRKSCVLTLPTSVLSDVRAATPLSSSLHLLLLPVRPHLPSLS